MSQTISLILVAPAPFASSILNVTSVNSVASVGGTLQFTAFAWDGLAYLNQPFGFPIQPQPTWTWASSNTGIATINSSTGLATGVSQGICTITASTVVSGQTFSGSAQFGVALISPATSTLNYGQSAAFTASSNAQWQSGIPAVAQMWNGNTNVFGSSATAITGVSTTHYPNSSQVVPIYAYIGGYGSGGIEGVIASANLTVNNIP